MSRKKPTPGDHAKKKDEVSLVRSSAAEYLTFIAANTTSRRDSCPKRQHGAESRHESRHHVAMEGQRVAGAHFYGIAPRGGRQTTAPIINLNQKATYAEGERARVATIKSRLMVRLEGTRQVSRPVLHYSLPVILEEARAVIKRYLHTRLERRLNP